jgi:hypothetical protein
MAKVTGPLMSMSASGTVGDTITFDKRNFVRQRVIPANPQTAPQGNVRLALRAIQGALKRLGSNAIEQVKTLAPTSYRWNSFLLQAVIGPASANYDAGRVTFAALTSTEKGHWETEGGTSGLVDSTIVYADAAPVTKGEALFLVCTALFALGIDVSNAVPGATNYAAWGTSFRLA